MNEGMKMNGEKKGNLKEMLRNMMLEEMKKERSEVEAILAVVGLDVIHAPDGKGFTIRPGKTEMMQALLTDLAPAFNFKIEFEMLGQGNEDADIHCTIMNIDLVKSVLVTVKKALSAQNKVGDMLKKKHEEMNSAGSTEN